MNRNHNIIKGIKKGDYNVLISFQKRNLTSVKGYILNHSGTEKDAEDIYQDAFIIIYNKLILNSLQINKCIHSYFLTVCKNLWRNELRKNSKLIKNQETIFQIPSKEKLITQHLIDNEKRELFQASFKELKAVDQKLLKLYFTGHSVKEIATLLGYSEGNVRKRKFDAKKKLLEMMEQDQKFLEFTA